MIGYTTIGCSDLDKALAFYDALLGEFGGKRMMETKNGYLYGFAKGPLFGVTRPFDGKVQHCGNGNMIALSAGSKEKVDAAYAKAIATTPSYSAARKVEGEITIPAKQFTLFPTS